MAHLHTTPGHHDFTISAFILRTDTPEPSVMLHLHRKAGMWLQFGGHIEHDETPWQGLLRELREESGYAASQLKVLQPPDYHITKISGADEHPLPFYFNTHQFMDEPHYHSDLVYAVVASEPPQHDIAPDESAAIKTCTATDLEAIPGDKIYRLTRANARYVLTRLRHDWTAVPASEWPVS